MSLYRITWAGAHTDRLRADGPYPTIAAAMAAIRLVCVSYTSRAEVCRSSRHDDGWSVYRCRSDRDYDRHGDAPGLAIAAIEEVQP